MSLRLAQVRLKVDRAKKHIDDVKAEVSAFQNANGNCLRFDADSQTGDNVYFVDFRTPIPEALPLIIGDCVHNLRCALDHLAWQLVEANGQVPGRNTQWPVFDTPEAYKAKSTGQIKGISSIAQDLIEACQPYNAGYKILGTLNDINNFDKHRRLMVAALTSESQSFGITPSMIEEAMRTGNPFRIDFALPGSYSSGDQFMNDGDEFCRIPSGGSKEHVYVEFVPKIAFREPEIVKGEAVIPFLTQLADFTEKLVEQFSQLL